MRKANGISDPQVANGKRTLLTSAASKGDKTTISNQRIISATDNADGSRTMRISYTLGGKSMTDILTVAPNGSKSSWIFEELEHHDAAGQGDLRLRGHRPSPTSPSTVSRSAQRTPQHPIPAPTPSRCIRATSRPGLGHVEVSDRGLDDADHLLRILRLDLCRADRRSGRRDQREDQGQAGYLRQVHGCTA